MNTNLDWNIIEDLIIDKLSGQITEENENLLQKYIQENQTVADFWGEMLEIYQIQQAGIIYEKLNPEDAWQKMELRISPNHSIKERKKKTIYRKLILYGSAAAILCVLLYQHFLIPINKNPINGHSPNIQIQLANGKKINLTQDAGMVTNGKPSLQALGGKTIIDADSNSIKATDFIRLSVPATKDYKLQLADGTEVWLNSCTSLDFPLKFSGGQRKIKLKGEAYFNVKRNTEIPFVVETDGMDIKVLGTELNIKAYTGEIFQASLVNGKIDVDNKKGLKKTIFPGQSAILNPTNEDLEISTFDESITLAWMKGIYYFQNEELSSIKSPMERWYDVKVEFENPSISTIHFTGSLDKNKPLTNFLDMIEKSAGIKYKIEQEKILFYQ